MKLNVKRILCVLLCLVLCLTVSLPAYAASVRYGDANDDGAVNMKDVLTLRQYLADWDPVINIAFADANGDLSVNMKDVLLVRMYLAGLPVTFGEFAKEPEGTVLCEGKDVRVSLYDIKPDGLYGYELWVTVENLTDRPALLQAEMASINDKMAMPLWICSLEPREEKVEVICLEEYAETRVDPSTVEKIEVLFIAADEDDNEDNVSLLDVGKQPAVLYPNGGEDTYETPDRTPENGVVMADTDTALLVLSDFEEEPGWFLYGNTFMKNRDTQPLLYTSENLKINGVAMENGFWLDLVLPGADSESSIMLDTDELNAAGITEIQTMTFTVNAYPLEAMLQTGDGEPLYTFEASYTAS